VINSLEDFFSYFSFGKRIQNHFPIVKLAHTISYREYHRSISFKFSSASNHYESHLRISDISTLESIPNLMFLALQSLKRRI
jgi:hypothetical protein